MASAPAALRPCAAHPEKGATETCARCGSYVCFDCFDYASVEPEWCADCRSRTGVERVPWERTDLGWPQRAVDTVVGMVRTPQRYLRYAHQGEYGPAYGFVAAVGLVNGFVGVAVQAALFLALGGLSLAEEVPEASVPLVVAVIALAVPFQAGLSVFWSVLWGGLFYFGTRLAGAQGRSPKPALKAVAYLYAYFVAALPLTILAALPAIGTLASFALLAVPALITVQLHGVALDHYGLSRERAWVASFFPVALFLVGFCGLMLGVVAVVTLLLTSP